MTFQEEISVIIYPGEQSGYVAECEECAIVPQGQTWNEVMQNLSEAIALYLEDED